MDFQTASSGLAVTDEIPSLAPPDADESTSYFNHSTTWTPSDSMTPISTNPSRKRSRDDTAFDDITAADGSYFPSLVDQVNTPASIPEEPIYGEGMTLLNGKGHNVSPESQTGTWLEEKVEEQPQPESAYRPQLPTSRKIVRLSQASVPTVLSAGTSSPFASLSAPDSPPKSSTHPQIDAATMALGVGWSKIAEDPDMQAAARGWARYLENHYARHIHSAEILLKSEGLNAYLVGCQEGFFLFREDLLEGRLVGRSWEAALVNLRDGPMRFEGEETLRAERTPGPEEKQPSMHEHGFEGMNGLVNNGYHDEGKVMMKNWADYNRLNRDGHAMVDGGMEID